MHQSDTFSLKEYKQIVLTVLHEHQTNQSKTSVHYNLGWRRQLSGFWPILFNAISTLRNKPHDGAPL